MNPTLEQTMSDLIPRLRQSAEMLGGINGIKLRIGAWHSEKANEAANHIEQLEAENAELKGDRDALSALLDDELYIRELVALWDRQAQTGDAR